MLAPLRLPRSWAGKQAQGEQGHRIGRGMSPESLQPWRSSVTTVPAPEAGRWLALLTDSLPTFVWSADAELILTACQGAALELVGLAPSDVVGRAVAETFGAGEAGQPALLAH